MQVEHLIAEMALAGRRSSRDVAVASTGQKNQAIRLAAERLLGQQQAILDANNIDMANAEAKGIALPLQDRLKLTGDGVQRMCEAARAVASLPDPVGAISDVASQPSGIRVGKMRIPLGVVGMIYESRPNVTLEAATLAIKSGNACILRGGSEAIESNQAIASCITWALEEAGLPPKVVQLVPTTDRAAVGEMLRSSECIDLIIPRGGKSLIERISNESTIPVLKHLDGVCHVYVDDSADAEMAVNIVVNSKAEKFAVCNAAETVLIAATRAGELIPKLVEKFEELGVELRGCQKSREIEPSMIEALESDWTEEYLAPVLALRVVDGVSDAINHIGQYGSGHTDAIVTNDHANTEMFLNGVDSASVMVNTSTQFADGFEYGLGAEIGISTDKLHARGPVGLEGLTTQKYVVWSNGEIRHR